MKRYSMKKRLLIVLMLVFFVCFGVSVFSQEKKGDDDKDKKLRDEILAVYQSKGAEGVKKFAQANVNRLTSKFIIDFAELGIKNQKEEWLYISKIVAEENKNEKVLADVYIKIGEYFLRISDFSKANHFYDIAIPMCKNINYIIGLGNIYNKKGLIYIYTGYNIKANKMFDMALILFKKSKYSLGQGKVYLGKGALYFHTGFKEKSSEMYEKAFSIFKISGDNSSLGNVLIGKGDTYYYNGENQTALEIYDEALSYYKKADEPKGCGNVLLKKGQIYARIGEHNKALNMYKDAEKYYSIAGSTMELGQLYSAMGNVFLKTCKYSAADELYIKALTYYEKNRVPRGQGNIYLQRGDIHLLTGDNTKAKEMLNNALIFFKQAGAPRSIGNVQCRKGDIYRYEGDNLKAIQMYEEAINYFKKAKYPIGLNNAYLRKGEVYLGIGNLTKAMEYYNQSLLFYQKEGDPLGLGDLHHRIGLIYFMSEKYPAAIEMCEKSLNFYKKARMPLGMGDAYFVMGAIYLKTGIISRALELNEKALIYYNKAKYPRGQSNYYSEMGDICFKKKDYLEASKMYDIALEISKRIGDIKAESLASYKKALVLVNQMDNDGAFFFFEKSIKAMEKIRRQIAFSDLQKTFIENVYDQYEKTALFMLENNYCEQGFKYTESMKARIFFDQLFEGLVTLAKGISPELKQKRDEYISRLSAINKQIAETAGKKDEKKLKELKEERRKVASEFEDLLIKIRLENPLYASVRYPQPVSLKSLRQNVLKKDEIMLRFFTTEERTYVFLVSRKKFKVIPLNITSKEIQKLTNRYLLSIKDKEKLNEYGTKLYQSLFKPLEPSLKGKKNLIIIPDGQLATIPFESFVTSKNEADKPVYLLEKYKIKYIQSASVLSTMRKHYKRTSKTHHFIGFGDPVYDYENFKKGLPEQGSTDPIKGNEIKEIHRGKYDREGGVLGRLQGSGQEVQSIAGLFQDQGQKTVIHLRETASEENAKSPDLKGFDYIHFSCHGILGDGFQSLVLSQAPNSREDGYLTLNEIMNCDYNAKLVVLSACKTGSGKIERGEGVTGLTRAVMYAGTPAVVASLWNVSDIGTKELMVQFYKNILEKGKSKEDALREAKLSLLRGGEYSSPYYWSPFVMYGE